MDKESKGTSTSDEEISYGSIKLTIDEISQLTDASLDRLIKSRSPFGKTKTILEITQASLDLQFETAKKIIQIMSFIEALQNQISALDEIVKTLVDQTSTDKSGLMKEIASLKKKQIPLVARQYIEDFRKEWAEFKQQSGRWFPDYVDSSKRNKRQH